MWHGCRRRGRAAAESPYSGSWQQQRFVSAVWSVDVSGKGLTVADDGRCWHWLEYGNASIRRMNETKRN